ncbi:MAG: hypothetical protein ACT4NY_16340 [Pseudonocardiales bacterium]
MTGPMTVDVVADVDGVVRIGERPLPVPLAAVLEVQGGVVVVDPLWPDGPPYVELQDVDSAAWWLPTVVGDDLAAAVVNAVAKASRLDPTTRETVRCREAWRPGPAHGLVARLALAQWLEHWSPMPLDQRWLDAEIGDLSLRCSDVVQAGDDIAHQRLSGALDVVLDVGHAVLHDGTEQGGTEQGGTEQDGTEQGGPGMRHDLADDLAEIVLSADEVIDRDHPRCPELTALSDWVRQRREEEGRVVTEAEVILTYHDEAPKFRARTAGGAEWAHSWDVDWTQLPARQVSPGRSALRWRLVDEPAGSRIEVEVDADPRADPSIPLLVRVFHDTDPIPAAIGPLRRSPEGNIYTGTVPFHGDPTPAAGELVVDVFAEGWVTRAPLGRARRAAWLYREAARAVCGVRAALAARAVRRSTVRGLLRFTSALDQWSAALEEDFRRRLPVESAGLLQITLSVPGLPPRWRNELRSTVGQADADRGRAPIVSSEAWRPTLAERYAALNRPVT